MVSELQEDYGSSTRARTSEKPKRLRQAEVLLSGMRSDDPGGFLQVTESCNFSTNSPRLNPFWRSETCRKFRPQFVRRSPTISRFFALPSKPGLCFDWLQSPEISARQKIFSMKGGVLANASRDARAVSLRDESIARKAYHG